MIAYHQPKTLDDALLLLARDNTLKVLAGATDVYPAQTARAGWGHMSHPPVLDLSAVPGLRGITEYADHWHIGAMTTWTDIARADLPPLFDGLKAAAREIGGIQIQNRGTIAGNICTASPAGDSIPCLLTLDAEIDIAAADGGRRLPLSQFIIGYRKTALRPADLVTGIRIPKHAGHGQFLKLGARRYLVISIAMIAGVFDIDDLGRIRSARVAIGACAPVAQRLPRLEARLAGKRANDVTSTLDDIAHLSPIDDVRASGDYRRAAALQLIADLLAEFGASNRRVA